MIEATVEGAVLLREHLTSPVSLAVFTLLALLAVGGYLYYGRSGRNPRKAKLMMAVSIITLVIYVTLAIVMIQPGEEYGAVLEGTQLTIKFYGTDRVTIDVCTANVSLLPVDEALGMVKWRANGMRDPVTGLSVGYYVLKDGRSAVLIVWPEGSDKVLVVEYESGVAMVGVPGVEELYQEIVKVKESCQS